MEYTINKLAKLAGVSTRTFRYYDEIDLLKPARINSSGYRIYGEKQVDDLQQILFYRELGLNLDAVKEAMTSPTYDLYKSLEGHREKLLAKREHLDQLITNVEKTIAKSEGRITMTDQEKFEGFKQKMIDENEERYGFEIREKYGDEQVDKSNRKLKGMTKEDHDRVEALSQEILTKLREAVDTGEPAGPLAQEVADLHRQWISFYWDSYSKEAHAGLAQMYVDDPRFTAYYDKNKPGAAVFLRDAVLVYTGMKK
ncbi:MerR family transcriptional regulator [Aquibacillus koreensis]|uniref:MerR family transcriptional regulator n=1 Tax=Aquibacillus koreensis TaxID=279446 RepID=A0A9X3WM64_9BACI|nr:MerR family transcriptional regulator [Aquibacillus koreensis]MCT2535276.1 MerR family transcriptional regulator [Aquibacillus koreensis]MDC3419791.1 MerR family transcriptional regulator [Aquibacillus koreensis]